MAAKKSPHEKAALAERLRGALAGHEKMTEKKMFGGTCFLLRDHMLCGTGTQGFLFRVGKEAHGKALQRPGAAAMVHSGRRLEGFIWVGPVACDAKNLKAWIALAESYVATLPPKRRK
jgi:TfoX N-terminal domain